MGFVVEFTSKMKLLLILGFVIAIAFATASDDEYAFRECYPHYMSCYKSAGSKSEKQKCVKAFVGCLRKYCDTKECDDSTRECLKEKTSPPVNSNAIKDGFC